MFLVSPAWKLNSSCVCTKVTSNIWVKFNFLLIWKFQVQNNNNNNSDYHYQRQETRKTYTKWKHILNDVAFFFSIFKNHYLLSEGVYGTHLNVFTISWSLLCIIKNNSSWPSSKISQKMLAWNALDAYQISSSPG